MSTRGWETQGNAKLPVILVTLGLIAIAIAMLLAPTNPEVVIPTKLTIDNIHTCVYFGVVGVFLCYSGTFLYWAFNSPRTRKIGTRR